MDKEYSKRELDHMFTDIQDTLGRIEEQTTRHNGRLSKLERYMWAMAGAISIISFLGIGNIVNVLAK